MPKTIKPFDFSQVKIERHFSDDEYLDGKEYKRYEITNAGISPRIIPGGISHNSVMVDSDEHDEYGHITESASIRVQMNDKRPRKMEFLKSELIEPEFIEPEFIGKDDFDTLLVGWGSLYSPIKEAVKLLNEDGKTKFSALIFGDVWPLPVTLIKKMSSKAKNIINIEQNATGQLASIIRENTGIEFKSSILKVVF